MNHQLLDSAISFIDMKFVDFHVGDGILVPIADAGLTSY